MSDDDVEWEYEDESDAAVDNDNSPEPPSTGVNVGSAGQDDGDEDADFQYSPGDDDGDVDWEDADQPMDDDEPDPTPASPGPDDQDNDERDTTERTVGDLNAVNWDHINSVLQREADTARTTDTSKTKRTVVRMTKEDKAHELALHKSHLLLLLAAQLRMNALCQSRVLRGLLLSLTSDSALDFFADLDTEPLKYALELLVRWFHTHFEVVFDGDEGSDDPSDTSALLTENRLLRAVGDRRGSYVDLALLFTALSRALGLHTRLVVAMDPLVVQQHSRSAETAATATAGNTKRKRPRQALRTDQPDDSTARTSRQTVWAWCEVLNAKTKNWIVVDAVRKVVNRPQDIGALRGKLLPLSYVVGVEADGFLTDVSPRYVDRWSKIMPRRLAHDWLMRSLQLMNHHLSMSDADHKGQALRELERTKLQQLTEAEEMPTSFEAFKKHHLFCLERHLTQFEVIYPRKAVGLFKGHAVFQRKSIQTTRSWFQWRRLGREVRDSEKDRPAKRLGAASGKANRATGENDSGDSDTDAGGHAAAPGASQRSGAGRALYGFWQTDDVVPPHVDGVTVPKNQYGNIELWSPAHLPIGAVHLQLPRIDKVAQQLGVDFAPAVVGFENRDGINYPQFDGIVVAAAVAETLLDAHAHVQHTMIEKAIDKNQQLIAKRWERLVKRLMLKQRLNEEYGQL